MNHIFDEFTTGLPNAEQIVRYIVRVLLALGLGAWLGREREQRGKPAGQRTHMLVALGSALFVLAAVESGATDSDVTRVLQGIVAGIGFLGGGAILKLTEERAIHGLTTAAGIWLTAALGAAAGLGRWGMAIICAALAWLTLELMYHFEVRPPRKNQANASDEPAAPGV